MKKEIAAIYCRLSVEDAEKRAAETCHSFRPRLAPGGA